MGFGQLGERMTPALAVVSVVCVALFCLLVRASVLRVNAYRYQRKRTKLRAHYLQRLVAEERLLRCGIKWVAWGEGVGLVILRLVMEQTPRRVDFANWLEVGLLVNFMIMLILDEIYSGRVEKFDTEQLRLKSRRLLTKPPAATG